MLKKLELAKSDSCLSKADPEEPIFVLRGNDSFAPQAVRIWAAMAVGSHEPEKIEEALEFADMMEKWRSERSQVAISASPSPSKLGGFGPR